MSAGGGGSRSSETLADGEGAVVFCGRPLWTAPNADFIRSIGFCSGISNGVIQMYRPIGNCSAGHFFYDGEFSTWDNVAGLYKRQMA